MWDIEVTDTFDEWFNGLTKIEQEYVLVGINLLKEKGPMLARPYADTVNDSNYNNMKELIVQIKGDPIRAFFAFDPNRKGIILCAGNKTGKDKQFYKKMIPIADKEYKAYLEEIL